MTIRTLFPKVHKRKTNGGNEAEGQGLVEYALIIFLISVASIVGLSAFGAGANSLYGTITAALPF
jgi:Flp pilus assembly pilin Flp